MKPKMDFGKSSKAFSRTLRRYADLSSKGAQEAINKKAKDVCIRAIRETPKADRGKIKSELEANGLVYRLIKKTGLKRAEIEKKAKAMIRVRQASIAYIKAGWYKAAQAFGGRGGKVRPDGLAAKGSGEKATKGKLTATLTNAAYGAPTVGGDALDRAMESVRKDMMVYLAKKLKGGWGKKR
jgi:hypothetical protein